LKEVVVVGSQVEGHPVTPDLRRPWEH